MREWAPDFGDWPKSWMGGGEDLEYGGKLLPCLEAFLQSLIDEGMSPKTFALYRDNVWLLGGAIIKRVSLTEEYESDPRRKLSDAVACGGMVPDPHMSKGELLSFERMCRRFEKFLEG